MVRETPLLFSTPMVVALLKDRKTETRRIIPGVSHLDEYDSMGLVNNAMGRGRTLPIHVKFKRPDGTTYSVVVPNEKGDKIWVRETLKWSAYATKHSVGEMEYQADGRDVVNEWPDDYVPPRNHTQRHWEGGDNIPGGGFYWYSGIVPSIFMPKWGTRIWLEVTDCFPQRIQSITRESCIAEGVHFDEGSGYWFAGDNTIMAQHPDEAFRDLWYDINGVESWVQNPWVWVRRFIIISKTGKP